MSADLELAYLAGVFDGEGCIGIYKRPNAISYFGEVVVKMNNREPLDLFSRMFGGEVRHSASNGVRDSSYCWRLINRDHTTTFLTALLPYLRVKRISAELVLQMYREVPKVRYCKAGMPDAYKEKLERYYQISRLLNSRGPGAEIKKERLKLLLVGDQA